MRQLVNENIVKDAKHSMDIDFAKLDGTYYTMDDARLFVRKYEASNGTEYFISFESMIKLYLDLRLRINPTNMNLRGHHGLIRELGGGKVCGMPTITLLVVHSTKDLVEV